MARKKPSATGGGGAMTFAGLPEATRFELESKVAHEQAMLQQQIDKELDLFERNVQDTKQIAVMSPAQRTIYNQINNGTLDPKTVDMRTLNAMETKGLIDIHGKRNVDTGTVGKSDIDRITIKPTTHPPMSKSQKQAYRAELRAEHTQRLDAITSVARSKQRALKKEYGLTDRRYQPLGKIVDDVKGIKHMVRMRGSVQQRGESDADKQRGILP